MCSPYISTMIDLELAYRIPEAINGMRKTPFTIIFTIDPKVIIGRFYEHFLSVNYAFAQARATGFCFGDIAGGSSRYDFSPKIVSQQDL